MDTVSEPPKLTWFKVGNQARFNRLGEKMCKQLQNQLMLPLWNEAQGEPMLIMGVEDTSRKPPHHQLLIFEVFDPKAKGRRREVKFSGAYFDLA